MHSSSLFMKESRSPGTYAPEQSWVVKDKPITINRKVSTKAAIEALIAIEASGRRLLQAGVSLLRRVKR
jgi:hypothetical protein